MDKRDLAEELAKKICACAELKDALSSSAHPCHKVAKTQDAMIIGVTAAISFVFGFVVEFWGKIFR